MKPFKSRPPLLVCLCVVVCLFACQRAASDSRSLHKVVRVFDGDTLLLHDGRKVRLIGIDCPEAFESDKLFRDAARTRRSVSEIQGMGRRAKTWTTTMALNKDVILEYDVEKQDRYGRTLAYVFIPASTEASSEDLHLSEGPPGQHIFLNASLIKAGYASPMTIPPNTQYAELFRRLHQEARDQGRGLWQ